MEAEVVEFFTFKQEARVAEKCVEPCRECALINCYDCEENFVLSLESFMNACYDMGYLSRNFKYTVQTI